MRPHPHPVGGTDLGAHPSLSGICLLPAQGTLAPSTHLRTIFPSQCPWGLLEGTKKITPTIFSTQSPCRSMCSISIFAMIIAIILRFCFTDASIPAVPYKIPVLLNLSLSLCLKRSFSPRFGPVLSDFPQMPLPPGSL